MGSLPLPHHPGHARFTVHWEGRERPSVNVDQEVGLVSG